MNLDEKLLKVKERHDLEMETMRLHNQMSLEKDELRNKLELQKMQSKNKIALQKANCTKDEKLIEEEVFRINMKTMRNTLTIKAGKLLKVFSFCAFLASTCLSLAGGWDIYSQESLTLFAFVFATVILQSAVFVISTQESRIKEDFKQHILTTQFLKYSLLVVSIYHSYSFFDVESDNPFQLIVSLLMCVALDFITVFVTSLSHDQITLNFNNKKERNFESDDKEIKDFLENEINGKPLNSELKSNFEVVEFNSSNGKEKVVSCETDIENDEIYKEFLDYIEKNCKDKSKLPGQKTLATKLNTTQSIISKIENILHYKGILDIRPNGTYWIT